MGGVTIERLFNVLGAIVTVALVATIVSPGSQAAQVITAFGNSFAHSISAARGTSA